MVIVILASTLGGIVIVYCSPANAAAKVSSEAPSKLFGKVAPLVTYSSSENLAVKDDCGPEKIIFVSLVLRYR